MQNIAIRYAAREEAWLLRPLWARGFEDESEFPEIFARTVFHENGTMILFEGKEAAAMVTALPCEIALPETDAYPAACVYGLTTLPEYRGRGYASLLLKTLLGDLRMRGAQTVFLRPASGSLFGYYRARGFAGGMNLCERRFSAASPSGTLREASAEEYFQARETLLRPLAHVRWAPRELSLQRGIDRMSGGGLMIYENGVIAGCASALYINGELTVNDALCEKPEDMASALCARFGAAACVMRMPAQTEKEEIPFGLSSGSALPENCFFGPDFA